MTLLKNIRDWLFPVQLTSSENGEVAHVLYNIEIAILAGVAFLLAMHLLAHDDPLIVPLIGLCLVIISSLMLIRRGSLRISGILISWGFLVFLSFNIWLGNGMSDAAVVAVPGILALATLALRYRQFLVFMLASVLSVAVEAWLEFHGKLHAISAPGTDPVRIIDLVVILVATGLLLRFLADSLLKSLSLAKVNERTLEQQADQLHESREYYRALFDGGNDAVFIVDGDSFVECNAQALRMFGCETKADIVGHRVIEFSPALQSDRVSSESKSRELVLAAVQGEPQQYFWKYARKDGTLFDAEVSLSSVRLDGRMLVQGFARDISEHNRTMEALREKTALLEAQLSSGVDGVLVVDNSGRKVLQNQRVVELWSLPSQVANDDRDQQLVAYTMTRVRDPRRFADTIARTYAHPDEVLRDEVELVDGTVLDRYSAPVKGSDGRHYGRIWVFRDITMQKRTEAQVLASLREKELLLKEIHHRVKNNMQVISSLLSMKAAESSDPGTREGLIECQRRVMAMALVHENLYRVGDLGRIDFQEYLGSVIAQHAPISLTEGIVCSVEAENMFLGIDTAVPCGLIANELVSNSFKHAFAGRQHGTVVVKLNRCDETTAQLIVKDDGVGFPEDKDFRELPSMGLLLVRCLVEQISGTITMERSKGTMFVIKFPV